MVTWPLLESRLIFFILYSLRKEYATKKPKSQANRQARKPEGASTPPESTCLTAPLLEVPVHVEDRVESPRGPVLHTHSPRPVTGQEKHRVVGSRLIGPEAQIARRRRPRRVTRHARQGSRRCRLGHRHIRGKGP